MNRKTAAFLYVGLPVLLTLTLLGMYFSGNLILQRIIAPNLPPMSMDDWREFGLLENLQHLCLLIIIAIACFAVYQKTWKWERIGFAILALGSTFVLLEEIDYGTIYYEFFTSEHDYPWFQPRSDWPPEIIGAIAQDTSFTLHNRLDLTRGFKKVGDTLLILLFGILPLLAWWKPQPWLRYLAPPPMAVAGLIAVFLLRELTHALGAWEETLFESAAETGVDPGRELGIMAKNLSEFRELNGYYLYLTHAATLGLVRRSPADPPLPQDDKAP